MLELGLVGTIIVVVLSFGLSAGCERSSRMAFCSAETLRAEGV